MVKDISRDGARWKRWVDSGRSCHISVRGFIAINSRQLFLMLFVPRSQPSPNLISSIALTDPKLFCPYLSCRRALATAMVPASSILYRPFPRRDCFSQRVQIVRRILDPHAPFPSPSYFSPQFDALPSVPNPNVPLVLKNLNSRSISINF